jgi:hypothetical protein
MSEILDFMSMSFFFLDGVSYYKRERNVEVSYHFRPRTSLPANPNSVVYPEKPNNKPTKFQSAFDNGAFGRSGIVLEVRQEMGQLLESCVQAFSSCTFSRIMLGSFLRLGLCPDTINPSQDDCRNKEG